MRSIFTGIKVLVAAAAAAAFLGFLALPIYKAYFTDEVVTAQVTEKLTKRGTNEDKYLVFTQGEVFENTDSLLRLKFNSSDIYGRIPDGATCTFLVNGWRFQFLSMYRNILEADCG